VLNLTTGSDKRIQVTEQVHFKFMLQITCRSQCFHSGVAEDSAVPGHDAVSPVKVCSDCPPWSLQKCQSALTKCCRQHSTTSQ